MAVDLNDTDVGILGELADGRGTPKFIADQLNYSRQAIQNRLTVLRAAGYVEKVHTGLYEITNEGRDALEDRRGAGSEE